MKRVEVKLNLEMVAPLLDVMKTAADELEPKLALEISMPGDDRELQEGWESDLLKAQTSDIQMLLGMFDHDFFASGSVAFDATNCEPIMRACSALRLRLRVTQLLPLGDDILESGEVLFATMPEEQRKAFAAYAFLATLQELLLQNLDPNETED